MSARLPLIEFPDDTLAWERIFHVPRPVQIEIGAGKGRFLIQAAEREPTFNWVGLERRWSAIALAVERIVRRGLDNAVYVRCDAMEVLRRRLAAASVAGFHLYYPDPWWKERHKKRRIVTPAVVADLARAARTGASLRIATDVEAYFEEIRLTLSASGLWEEQRLPSGAWGEEGEPLTSYEAKYRAQGRASHRAIFARGDAPAPPPEPWVSRKPTGQPLGERLILPRLNGGTTP